MQKITISIVTLGHQKDPIDFRYLDDWKSAIFSMGSKQAIPFSPNANGENWEYPDAQIRSLVKKADGANLTVVLVSAPIERNFYSRRLGDNTVVVSLHEMAHILRANNFRIEDFLLRNFYGYSVYFHAQNGRVLSSDTQSWSHHDIRGCLFDMNTQKHDILYSMHRPQLCGECMQRLQRAQVNAEFPVTLQAELLKIQRPLFFQATDWITRHPIYSLMITATFGVFLNLIASAIFEKSKVYFPWLAS